ncbi:CapA family protein [Nocardioides sp. URHA0032]|uniref:CapA family protein n=1 Tax=Nocardioides sp. URHA0032 TaxID=1380388 RepID=UPI00068454DA|nr:CapA family protein [Nocardioides sp. URHA0032]
MIPRSSRILVGLGLAVLLVACSTAPHPTSSPPIHRQVLATDEPHRDHHPHHVVSLAFAGDIHFQIQVAALLDDPRGFGPISRALADADLTMVNLESAITERDSWDPKSLERPRDRYWFRAPPRALDVLADAGVDVVTVANNHGADLGAAGLHDTLLAARHAPLAVVGVGDDRAHAFTPYRVRVRGTDLAFLTADTTPLESTSPIWTAGRRTPGLAAARGPRPRVLLRAVRRADRDADVVVVYLHWGRDMQTCPTLRQRTTAHALAAAGADVLVGSHAHVQLGSGWQGDTYVNYGLGNFVWYHNHPSDSGVLQLRLEDGKVVSDQWTPARIGPLGGAPLPLSGTSRQRAVTDWQVRRGCAGLASGPTQPGPATYRASVEPITPVLRQRMRTSHHPGCPVPWRALRYLQLSYVGFDGRPHTGEMVVAAPYAHDVVGVFRKLYDARWPIRRIRLVDAYGGDDDRSMAADNTSAANCRKVEGSGRWSDHAFGAAIDLNPVQNPYLTGSRIAPPGSRRFATLDRSAGARVPDGVIRSDDVVVRAFAAIGWEWGGSWTEPDFQHFSATTRRAADNRARGQ